MSTAWTVARELWEQGEQGAAVKPLRPKQQWPAGIWRTWLILAGRRWGKTMTAARHLARFGTENRGWRIAVMAPTYAQARDVCIEGPTGLLTYLDRKDVLTWNRSLGELRLHNGTTFKLLSADEPDRVRGWGFHLAWCDELASYQYPDAWHQLQYALSAGSNPQVIVTTTPKPTPLIRELVGRDGDGLVLTRGSIFENADNLSPEVLRELEERYAGTRLGRQELYAEVLDDVEGALWTLDLIARARVDVAPALRRRVLVVDPTSGEGKGDETGIVHAGETLVDGLPHAYVLDDRSLRGTPEECASAIATAYDGFDPDRLYVEDAFGQIAQVKLALRAIGRGEIPVTPVPSRVGPYAVSRRRGSNAKALRAEPVVSLYEQKRVHHVGEFPELEAQQTGWVPDESDFSPDRLEALVHAVTVLLLRASGPGRSLSVAGMHVQARPM